jgi:lysophospholipid acyltransferase (LPLAT)-like uncharacterized protein
MNVMANPKVQIAERGRPLGSSFKVWLNYRLVPFLGAQALKLLRLTLRARWEGGGPVRELIGRDQRIILAFWHRRLVMMPLSYPFHRRNAKGERRGVAILSSDSKDGEISAATWRWFGIHAVRGTAADDGAKALVRMIRAVKDEWDFGITPDGPRGPLRKLKPGVIALARKTGAWIVPVCVAYSRAWKLGTWDAMLVPKPFSRVIVRYGTPFQVPAGSDDEMLGQALEATLNELEAWAEDVNHA